MNPLRYGQFHVGEDSDFQFVIERHLQICSEFGLMEFYVEISTHDINIDIENQLSSDYNTQPTPQTDQTLIASSSRLQIVGTCQPPTEDLGKFSDEDEYEASVPIRMSHQDKEDDNVWEDVVEEELANFYSQVDVERARGFTGDFGPRSDDVGELYEGMKFPTKAALRRHRCPKFGKECAWRLRATQKVNTYHWEITICPEKHKCVTMTLSQDHPKLDSDVIASFIISMVTLEPDVSVASIIERMNTQFQFEVSYKKAWLAKHKAITRVFGNWESSYSKLPRWMAAIQHFLPGTVVQFCYKPRPRGVPSDPNIRIFQRVFWAYKPCIDAFPHLKPMVQVDGTFLYGKYTQTLLIASSQDGNSNVVPLAFAIVEGETLEAWAWFLKRVRLHVVGERHNICLISDRHPSILSAVSDPRTMWQPPYGHHVHCIRHLASNLNKKYSDSNLKDLFVNIDFHRMAVPRQTIIHPGPEDPSLLTLQNKHISEHVWQGYPERVLRCRRSSKDHPGLPPQPILNVLKQTGFYGVSRLRYFEFDNALVSALVERWRPETHTFHMPQGECTITLQDVAILLGLPCVGVPIVGRTDLPWATVCEGLLGQTPLEGKLKGQRLSMKWLDDTFSFANFPPNPTAVDIEHFARAYILKLIGGYLMPDKSSKEVYLMYLPLLADLTAVRTFSWGSAVLAYLYRELCNATDPNTSDISGCMVLLHLWAWDRFPGLAPHQPHFIDPQLNVFGDLPPLGYRWTCIDVHYHQRYDTLKKYRLLLDSLKEDQIKWRPYDEDHVSQQIPHYCIDNRHIWLANVPLICFHIVEWQYSDRVLRHFGMDQPIPENPVDIDFLHTLKLTGNISANWFIEHQFYIHVWNNWQARVAFAPPYHGFGTHVRVYNNLRNNLDLTIHCKSRDDDLGKHVLHYASNGKVPFIGSIYMKHIGIDTRATKNAFGELHKNAHVCLKRVILAFAMNGKSN
ncbi:serine/threonine-protein phosphatase 7 long form-like protein [Senna tora]|uniref:Serine/threonine-protein phosphatase 7 long form-like protein n=1 Tax=Senna tora TaxID=362788 RepID=A0A834XI99_9FABA|nr:serine/threonine-protein phosphatase 7 long form-like protein [Senna tora]